MDRRPDSSSAIEDRRKYTEDFNQKMIEIWRDRLKKFGLSKESDHPLRTAGLFREISKKGLEARNAFTDLRYSFSHREYGIYVERGTGRGVFRGNAGDIGRENLRRKNRIKAGKDVRPWRSRPLRRSLHNLRDFLAESLGIEFVEIIENIDIDHGDSFAFAPRTGKPPVPMSVPGVNLPH